jgi:uncharacterized membrane protein
MTFFFLLVGIFALVHVPPLARLVRAPTRRDRMRVAAGVAFIVASLPHFTSPERYLPMMPPFVPAPLAMIYVSGVAELLGGIGLLIPRTARPAAWGVVALLIAIFPANIYVAISGVNAAGLPSSPWYTWSRLPFQIVFIWWVLAATRPRPTRSSPSARAILDRTSWPR